MRSIASSALASVVLLLGGTSVKADWDHWGLIKYFDAPYGSVILSIPDGFTYTL